MCVANAIEDISDIRENYIMKGNIKYVKRNKTYNYYREA